MYGELREREDPAMNEEVDGNAINWNKEHLMKKNLSQILAYCFYITYLLGDIDLMEFFLNKITLFLLYSYRKI